MSAKPRRLRPSPAQSRQKGSPRGSTRPVLAIALFTGLVLLTFGGLAYLIRSPKTPTPRAATPTAAPATNPTPSPTPATGPRISYARAYDFGRAAGDSTVDCRIAITNAGTATLEVTEVQPGCGCMKAGEWSRQIAPGQSGTVNIRLDTRGYTGNFAKSVFLTCNDPTQGKVNIEIQGYIQRALEIKPASLALNLNSETPSNQASVVLINHLDVPVGVFNPRSSLTNVELQLVTNQPGKEYQLLARTLPPLPTSRQVGQVTLATSNPDVPTTNLNLFLNYQEVVQAIPFQLRLPPGPLTTPTTLNAWIRNNGTNALAVTEAGVNAPGVTVKHEDDPFNRGIRFNVELPAGFQAPANRNLELTIQTTHPLHPLVRIPLVPSPPAPR